MSMKVQADLTGLVLCGGQSSRMGTDKGLLSHNGKSWSVAIADLIGDHVPDVFISLRKEQAPSYESMFKASQMIFDQNDIQVNGPLKGLLSAHRDFPDKNWLVVACDMISISSEILYKLVKAFEKNPGYGSYMYKNQSNLEPLCGVYMKNKLNELFIKSKHISDFSLVRNLNMNHCFVIEADENDVAALRNYNKLRDYEIT